MVFFKKNIKRITEQIFGKSLISVPKTAQETIPFIDAYENGLFRVSENTYTLIFSYKNIDYALLRETEQKEKYQNYINLLNSLPTDVQYQEFTMNSKIDINTIRKTLLPKFNGCNGLWTDYCKIMQEYIEKTETSASQKIMCIALSFTPANALENVNNILFKYYRELQIQFEHLGSETKQLFPEEVFAVLYQCYHRFDKAEFKLPKDLFARGGKIKDYIAPSIFNFKNKYIEVGQEFTRILFVKNYDRFLDDQFIIDLLDNNEKITVSKQIKRMDKGDAAEMLRKRVFDVQGKIQKRMEDNAKRGTNFIPFRLQEMIKELENLQNQLSDTDCELFKLGIFISVSAQSKTELNSITQFVLNIGRKHQIKIDVLTAQQEKGLNTVLPFAVNNFNDKNGNTVNTYLLSNSAGVLIPFSNINHFTKTGLCYGLNKATNAIICINRMLEQNANGFILGTSGSGKSMFCKGEIWDVVMKFPDDEIIIIDPDNEYRPVIEAFNGEILRLAPSSNTRLNVFDTDLSYSDNGESAIAMKSSFIMSIVETAKGLPLTATEKTIIDRCVKLVYADFVNSDGDKKYIPTFEDLYNILIEQEDEEARTIALNIELYVKGSFNVFAGHTNIEINKKMICFDISDMGEQLRPVGLQVVLEYVWQRVAENQKRGVRTWVWTDEFSVMFNDGNGKETLRSGQFFARVYKRIRKYGGIPTAITQNVSDIMASPQAKTMMSNSEFVVLLQQKTEDLNVVSELFSLSDTQKHYLKTGERGTGLIICGNKIIPFTKQIPENSEMYKICSTKFEDKKKLQEQKTLLKRQRYNFSYLKSKKINLNKKV